MQIRSRMTSEVKDELKSKHKLLLISVDSVSFLRKFTRMIELTAIVSQYVSRRSQQQEHPPSFPELHILGLLVGQASIPMYCNHCCLRWQLIEQYPIAYLSAMILHDVINRLNQRPIDKTSK